MESPGIVIIGAGPAGIRCAEILVKHGIRPVVIDEQPRSGGQIYKRQPQPFQRSYQKLYGSEYQKAQAVHQTFDQLQHDIDYYPETSVWAIHDKTLYAHQHANPVEIRFDFLILCTGATDRVLPVEGWEQAGTYSLGGAQIALKHQACAIGHQVAFTGTGPLLYLVAYQYLKAGATIAGVYDTSGFASRLKAMDKLLMKPYALWQGLKMIGALKRAKVPVHTGVTPEKITGEGEVTGLEVKLRNGQRRHVACDAVALGFHIKPETQLADLAGCEFSYDTQSQLWLPDVDQQGRTSVPHVFCAGDGCRILGADAAELSGKLVAFTVLEQTRSLNHQQKKQQSGLLARFRRMKRFGDGLLKAFPWPAHLIDQLSDKAVVCRCEMITKAEVKLSVREKEATEVNRSKSFSRVGMGRCQGRYCAHVNAHIIAKEHHHVPETGGRQRSQAPVKPIPVNVYTETSGETHP
ncbi:FAD/NAD(P)-dependent oxidoreductase [Vibrio quintilis]|uniref:Hydrogen cyanide synthase subunit HcnB n=1 Tax=Vibrio quintilis TaxID=1117707 RepID=A0A1M7YTW7_9VIBR|nr:FAD/NAD(P)-binding oxidoreductase [Vibrio quintilis]SHO55981.1 Hydrogen cyanide synthase subunit HcnB [Vibrio quintilis]